MTHPKNLREVPVKVLFSTEEKRELKKEFKSADVTGSQLLRDFALCWMAERKNSRLPPNRELPGCGHNMATSYAGRSHGQVGHGASNHMRRRL